MRAFLIAVATGLVVSVAASYVLDGFQRSTDTANTTIGTRIR